MAFVDVPQNRRVLQGIAPVDVLLAERVYAGDPLGISGGTWVLSAHASTEQPLLIAGVDGIAGETIKAYPIAVIECVNTAANVATVGEIIALTDAGAYAPAGAGLPDVGFCVSVGSDSLTSVICVIAAGAQIDTPRT